MEVLYETGAAPLPQGALLAEELSIKHHSPFPAFLEMMFISKAEESARLTMLHTMSAASKYDLSSSGGDDYGLTDQGVWRRMQLSMVRCMQKFQDLCLRRYDLESIALLTFLMERKCLGSKACASFSESLSGMKRSKIVTDTKSPIGGQSSSLQPLSRKDKIRAALLLALVPYMRAKLERYFVALQQRHESQMIQSSHHDHDAQHNNNNGRTATWKTRLRQIFLHSYPFLHMTMEGTVLFYRWWYLLGRTLYFSPSLRILGTVLHRYTDENKGSSTQVQGSDDNSQSTKKSNMGAAGPEDAARKARAASAAAGGAVALFLLRFVLSIRQTIISERMRSITPGSEPQFSDGNNLNETQRRLQHYGAFPPPMPPPLTVGQSTGEDGDNNSAKRSLLNPNERLCPLCHDSIVNPTAASSGYVFCYRCIILHVREHGCCPLTNVVCRENELVRLRRE
jgi:peroxin-12